MVRILSGMTGREAAVVVPQQQTHVHGNQVERMRPNSLASVYCVLTASRVVHPLTVPH